LTGPAMRWAGAAAGCYSTANQNRSKGPPTRNRHVRTPRRRWRRRGPRLTRSGSISSPMTRTAGRTVRNRAASSSVVTGSRPYPRSTTTGTSAECNAVRTRVECVSHRSARRKPVWRQSCRGSARRSVVGRAARRTPVGRRGLLMTVDPVGGELTLVGEQCPQAASEKLLDLTADEGHSRVAPGLQPHLTASGGIRPARSRRSPRPVLRVPRPDSGRRLGWWPHRTGSKCCTLTDGEGAGTTVRAIAGRSWALMMWENETSVPLASVAKCAISVRAPFSR